MPNPTNHLFEVTLQITGWTGATLDLKMPVWTPGSYLVREYARHVQDFAPASGNQALLWKKMGKNHWQIATADTDSISVSYRVFANELTVRTNHLDATHGYFNGAALFFFVPGLEDQPITLRIHPPYPTWQVATALPACPDQANTFIAADFDTLVDSPVEIGTHSLHSFDILGKPHQLAIWGKGNADPERIIADTQAVIQKEAEMFGGLPYDRYLFLLHLSAQGFGGLEHKESCALNYPRLGFQSKDKYQRFMQLVAHEFFHLWNVKRIRPKSLENFDYETENYTPSLWFCEGATSYYDLAIPFRAGLYNAKTYVQELNKELTRYLSIPGRTVQPLSESSFDAWIKLYRRDANSDNSQISYYLKGEMVAFLLDLLIRARHNNGRSLDDVMREMWLQFGKDEIGFTPSDLRQVVESVADQDLSDFFHLTLESTDDLPFATYLQMFGLALKASGANDQPAFTGMTVVADQQTTKVKFVEIDSPAQQAGIDAGDELLAIAGFRITADTFSDRIKDYQPGDRVPMTIFHSDELITCDVTLTEPRPNRYQLVPVPNPSPEQRQRFEGWLGIAHEEL